MIELKDISGNTILSTQINSGSKKRYTLMKEDSITVRFSLETPIAFQLGTYIDDSEIGLYELTELYNPTYNTSTGAYDYELKLDAYYFKWKNKIFKFTPEAGGQEASWNLTASLNVQMGVFLRNLSALGYTYKGKAFTFSIDSTVENSAKLISYDNTNMLDALSIMAETWECEWWVTGNVIHFGRCEYGTAVDFEVGENVEEMTSSGNRSTYATRIYAFGSTRNLPPNYRPVDSSVTVNGIVQKRLMLPKGTPYIDAYPNMPTEQAVEQVVVFDDVYPKTNGNISSVSSYESTVNNEDGTTTTETFYRFKDDGITFSKEYILENEELHVIFQSGALNGMDFGVRFNPSDAPEKLEDGSWNPDAQLWEIVANEDYGRKLPDNVLKPKAGDTYVLYGWDSTKITELGLVDDAEQELKQKAEKYVAKSKIDPNTYSCKMMSDYMYGLDANGKQNSNYAKKFDIGDRVNLINPAFFEAGSRQSRIIGYEYNLDKTYDSPVYSVGETASYSRLGSIEEKLDELTIKGQTYTGGGGSGTSIYVIGTNDTTPASNRNVYSAYRSQQEFLNKRKDDRSVGRISSDIGFEVGNFVSGASGGIFYKDKETGQTYAELDKLRVRMKAYFESLEIVNVNSIGGKQVISPAGAVRLSMAFMPGEKYDVLADDGSKLEVTVPDGVYRCLFLAEQDGQEVENRFKAGDQLQSKDFNITKPGEYNQVTNHYYWRLVTGVSMQPVRIGDLGYHYVDLSVTDCDTGSDSPAKGDVVAQLGNRNDVDRQNALVFSSVDTFSPSITLYQGINSYSYLGKEMVSYGVDKTTGKAFFNVYGDMYIGDRNGTSYVKFTQETGAEIKGNLSIDSTIGDKNITEYIKENSGTDEETVRTIVKSITDDLQNQIDGTIETYFLSGTPTLSNLPASEWVQIETETNKETYDKHVGDLYYDKDTGYGYRFMKDGNTYKWELLKDTDVTKALADAAKAQETADGKMKVFDHQPTDSEEYEVGDIWVNATYGNIYSNDILRAVTAKAAGAAFNISHWTKASKYTDDSKAEEVQKNVDALGETVNNMNKTVNNMKNFTDKAFADGIVDRSEKSAIENYLNNIETTKAEVTESYGKVYGNALLDGVAKTNLANAYTAFGTAANELKSTITNAIADGVATSVERASVDQKYTNFNTRYGEFIAYLNAANKHIQDKINANANKALEQVASLDYLKKALKEHTEITGGLIQSSMLALGYTDSNNVFKLMSGTNGIYDSSKRGGGIASWWGGGMFDRFDYTSANMPSNVATGLVRFDGTGYFANGNLWWDADGTIHADPQSFIINENQLGDYLELFQIRYKGDTKDIDYIIPQYPMRSLQVASEIRLGNGVLKWDEVNQGFYVEKADGGVAGFYSTSYLSAKGVNADAGGTGSGVVQSVYGYGDLGKTFLDADLNNTFNAYTINKLASRLAAIEGGALTSVDWSIITGKPTTIAGYGITDAKILGGVITLGNNTITPLTSHQPLSHIKYLDNRNDNLAPYGAWAYKGVQYSLKYNSADGLSDGGSYHGSMTLHKWGDVSGEDVHQLGFTSNGNLWMRSGTSSWSTWRRFAYADEAYTKAQADGKYVSALSTSGNYLTWTKNGTANNITVPYATASSNTNRLNSIANSSFGSVGVYYHSGGDFIVDGTGAGNAISVPSSSVDSQYKNGQVLRLFYNSAYYTDIFTSPNYHGANTGLYYRQIVNGTAHEWRTLLDSVNYANLVKKVGTSTVGSTAKPIYLNAGIPTALSSTVGGTAKPVYMNAGTITALSATVGSAVRPVYMNGGTITAGTYTFGNASGNAPISNGTLNTNLNADMLDGAHLSSIFSRRGWYDSNADALTLFAPGIYMNATGNGSGNKNWPSTYGVMAVFSWNDSNYTFRLHSSSDGHLSVQTKFDVQNTSWRTLIDNVNLSNISGSIRGENVYSTGTSISKLSGSPTITRGMSYQGVLHEYGFALTGDNSNKSSARMSNVFKYEGTWTVSFEIRGSQSVSVGFELKVDNQPPIDGNAVIRTNTTNTWTKVVKSFNVPSDNLNLDFLNISCAYIHIRNFKVEKGLTATYFTPGGQDAFHQVGSWTSSGYIYDWISRYIMLHDNVSNPYLRFTLNSVNWYVQAYNNTLAFGSSYEKSIRVDSNGILTSPVTGKAFTFGANGAYIGSNSGTDFYMWCDNNIAFRLGTNNLERLRILGNGNVGIGTTSPAYKLDVKGILHASSIKVVNSGGSWISQKDTISCIYGDNFNVNESSYKAILRMKNVGGNVMTLGGINNQFGFWGYKSTTTSNSYDCSFYYGFNDSKWHINGVFHSSTGIYSDGYVSAKGQNTSSDMRLKNKLRDISVDVRKIACAPSFEYTWKDGNGGIEAGSSAQYWEHVLPQLVKERDGYKEMAYGNIALLSAISIAKGLLSVAGRTETLEEKVKRLERENKNMKKHIKELERRISA